jgi:putative membrane protein
MSRVLSRAELDTIEALVAEVELRTGVQVAVAAIGKSDSYVELPWKAFALGASVAAFAAVGADLRWPQWVTAESPLVGAIVILGTASACALLAVFVPPFARLFLSTARGHLEVKHYAQSLFLTRELFRTQHRTAVLILVSDFERRIEILPDVGLHNRVSEPEWRRVIDALAPRLREARPFHALQDGLAAVEHLLVSKGFRGRAGTPDDLPDRPIDERGA